jgi:hypothetical protein
MAESLAVALGKAKATIDSVLECLPLPAGRQERLSAKAGQKLLAILSVEAKTVNGLKKATDVLGMISSNAALVNQLANDGRSLPAILERMVATAIASTTGTVTDQKMIVVVFDLIGASDKVKAQLCMTIHEYALAAIEHGSLHPAIESKVLELLVSVVTHHQENRVFFVKNTSKERVRAVMAFLTQTGNPMAQIFAVEFLWRIALPMSLSAEEKRDLFGAMADHLFTIGTQNFRAGILNFVEVVNTSRGGAILQFRVRELVIGEIGVSLQHTVYVGTDTILVWMNREAELSEGKNEGLELISLSRHDIMGVGRVDHTGCII